VYTQEVLAMKQNPSIPEQIVFATRTAFVRLATSAEKSKYCGIISEEPMYLLSDVDGNIVLIAAEKPEYAFQAGLIENYEP